MWLSSLSISLLNTTMPVGPTRYIHIKAGLKIQLNYTDLSRLQKYSTTIEITSSHKNTLVGLCFNVVFWCIIWVELYALDYRIFEFWLHIPSSRWRNCSNVFHNQRCLLQWWSFRGAQYSITTNNTFENWLVWAGLSWCSVGF